MSSLNHLVSLEEVDNILNSALERARRPLLETLFGTFEDYKRAFGRYESLLGIKKDFKDLEDNINKKEDEE